MHTLRQLRLKNCFFLLKFSEDMQLKSLQSNNVNKYYSAHAFWLTNICCTISNSNLLIYLRTKYSCLESKIFRTKLNFFFFILLQNQIQYKGVLHLALKKRNKKYFFLYNVWLFRIRTRIKGKCKIVFANIKSGRTDK